jgi:hypothetical protein
MCPYLERCLQFKNSALESVSKLFAPEDVQCFCKDCYREAPIKEVGCTRVIVPTGWARFGLRLISSEVEAHHRVHETYLQAFHGTPCSKCVSIIHQGTIMRPGDITSTGDQINMIQGHVKDGDFVREENTEAQAVGKVTHKLVKRADARPSAELKVHNPSEFIFSTP